MVSRATALADERYAFIWVAGELIWIYLSRITVIISAEGNLGILCQWKQGFSPHDHYHAMNL